MKSLKSLGSISGAKLAMGGLLGVTLLTASLARADFTPAPLQLSKENIRDYYAIALRMTSIPTDEWADGPNELCWEIATVASISGIPLLALKDDATQTAQVRATAKQLLDRLGDMREYCDNGGQAPTDESYVDGILKEVNTKLWALSKDVK